MEKKLYILKAPMIVFSLRQKMGCLVASKGVVIEYEGHGNEMKLDVSSQKKSTISCLLKSFFSAFLGQKLLRGGGIIIWGKGDVIKCS